jgi:hypothetical protein
VFIVQLGFHQTPTLKCTIMNIKYVFQSENPIEKEIHGACLDQTRKKGKFR